MALFTAIATGIKAATSIAGAFSGWKKKKAAKKANKEAKKKMEAAKEKYMNLDTSNPYLNMENTMEDLTVNQEAAEFEKQAAQQSEANILSNMNKAAGGSGVAALAQALANQGQIGAQKASISIADQEKANQAAERRETSRLQGLEREGEIQSRNLKRDMAKTEMGMASADVQSTAAEMEAGGQQISSGISGVGSAVGSLFSALSMRSENSALKMKSPLKASTTLNTGGADVVKYYQDALAAQRNQKKTWEYLSEGFGDITSGLVQHVQQERKKLELEKKAEEERIKGYENMFSTNVDKIAAAGGELGGEYYDIAYDQAKTLQDEYMKAVKANDKKKQGEIKMKLQGLSTSVGTLQDGLNLTAELQNNEEGKSDLSAGMTEQEKMIIATCTDPKNMVYKDGEFLWKNPDYNPNIEGSKEYFDQGDLSNSLIEIDRVVAEEYRLHEQKFNISGLAWANGDEGSEDFNRDRINSNNKNFITEDNIASIMHDDFRGVGEDNTFSKQLDGYLQDVDYSGLGLDPVQWDDNNDGIVNYQDFILDQDKEKLRKAITDRSHPLYNFETSKNIIAEWMTMHQEKAFFGNVNPDLLPEPGESQDMFLKRGGSIGALKKKGIVWNADTNTWQQTDWDSSLALEKWKELMKKKK